MSQSRKQIDLELNTVNEDQDSDDTEIDDNQQSLWSPSEQGPDEQADSQWGPNSDDQRAASRAKDEGLEEYGVEDDPSPNNARLDNPDGELTADRRTNKHTGQPETEQADLFPDIENKDQVTLGGEPAYNQCLFE